MKKVVTIAFITAAMAVSSVSFAARGAAPMCPFAESDLGEIGESDPTVSFVFDDKLNGDYFIGFYGTKDRYGFTPENPKVDAIADDTQFNGYGESNDLSAAIYVFNKNPRNAGSRVICYVGNDANDGPRPFKTGYQYKICAPGTTAAACGQTSGGKKGKKSSGKKRR